MLQTISRDYAKSWFLPDIISVIPFDTLLQFGNLNRLARFSRLGKIYKVIKVSKLMRLVKSIKARSKMSKHLSETLKINQGIERIMLMLLTFVFMVHSTSCIW